MIRRRHREHAIYSSRQRMIVLTFDSVAEAIAFDALGDEAGRAITDAITDALSAAPKVAS